MDAIAFQATKRTKRKFQVKSTQGVLMEFIPTNDVFKHLLSLMRLRDKDEIVELFNSQGIAVTKSQIKSWQTMTGNQHPGYRDMPREKLDAFIKALHESRLIE